MSRVSAIEPLKSCQYPKETTADLVAQKQRARLSLASASARACRCPCERAARACIAHRRACERDRWTCERNRLIRSPEEGGGESADYVARVRILLDWSSRATTPGVFEIRVSLLRMSIRRNIAGRGEGRIARRPLGREVITPTVVESSLPAKGSALELSLHFNATD